ncbi:MAG: carbamoyl-phosphate synthase large subunit [Nitrospirae bacterium]|nr:carbamoyl-phosphate synthase large subunit [Nitrospirota bacterium]
MPKRTDIKKILIIGSGPIVIGQGCEFDYSGTQACKVLREEGFKVVLINSNPATIMTDPDLADATYIEPILPEYVEKIIEIERPDALLPTMGGQTALNTAVQLVENGVLEKYHVRLIGANYNSIKKAENRQLFKKAMEKAGIETPKSGYARSKEEALGVIEEIGFPAIIRASFTLGGAGGSIAYNREEFEELVELGLAASPSHEVLIEQSVIGWKEFELELMRDKADNVAIICSIENIDPMGVHTGDSITVAPIQTLSDKEYQRMRDAAIRVIREIGVETGGSNIQFSLNPKDGKMFVIEMNPRVSRSSALSSKATGYPIAKIAAKLAVGYTLDEIPNDITRTTPASFEPTLDYVVVKIPRFDFEKFPQADQTLTPQMKSVGEVMAIGRTFKESLQKAITSLEIDRMGLDLKKGTSLPEGREKEAIKEKLLVPNPERIFYIAEGFRQGFSLEEIAHDTHIDPWFLYQIKEIVLFEEEMIQNKSNGRTREWLEKAKRFGFSDQKIGEMIGCPESEVYQSRKAQGVVPVFKRVDTCAAEFEAYTPYLYSTYEKECEASPTAKKKVMILGGGPNRIGQGIEFDYCCVHGVMGLKEEGYETIMVNCNPETVSTDYDTADRLYFEPLTLENVLRIIETEKPEGVVVQFGGQTPLKLALPLEERGIRILGTSPDSIDLAEDRERFKKLVEDLQLAQPQSGSARSFEGAKKIAETIGYPVMVRPSYVLGGKSMMIVYDSTSLEQYMKNAVSASRSHPVLIDKYLEDAIEIDVDAISDGDEVVVGGIMEHIEEAGIHSGDSACSLPPFSLAEVLIKEIKRQTIILAKALKVVGLINIQFAVKNGEVFILEVNPRASRTVPFVSKTIGLPLAKLAIKLMVGRKLKEFGLSDTPVFHHVAVKEAVFPFNKFPGVDPILGPEMKSTGEVMGIDVDFGKAFAKSQSAAGSPLPLSGTVFLSVKDKDKPLLLPIARDLFELGFKLIGTRGTVEYLSRHQVKIGLVNKIVEGRPHVVDHMKNMEIQLSINTVGDKISQTDSYPIRQTTLQQKIPYFTTMAGARAAVRGISSLLKDQVSVQSLQQYHQKK